MHHGGGGKGAGVYHAPVNHASYTRGIRPADGGPGAGATAVETGSASVLHENNYDPSTGSPARSFVRKGYFNDPDWTGPRQRPQVKSQLRSCRKTHALAPGRVGATARAVHGDATGMAMVFRGERAAPHYQRSGIAPGGAGGTHVGAVYHRSKNEVWTTEEQMNKDFAASTAIAVDFQGEIVKATQKRAEIKQERAKQNEADLVQLKQAANNPYGRGKTGTRKHLRKFHGIIPNPPIEVLDDHSDRPLSNIPGFDKPQHLKQARIPGEVRQEFNTDSLGAIRYDNEPNERRARQDRVKQHKANLDELVIQRKIEAQVKREQSDLETAADTGVVGSRFGTAGCGNPHIGANGEVLTRLPGTMLLPGERKVGNTTLAETLQRQIARENELKKYRKNPLRYETFQEHHPFSPAYKATETVNNRKVQRTTGNGMAQVDNIIEGHSLINKFGAPGGGAPRDYKDPNHKVLALNMMDVEYGKELEAQNAGTSIFGKAGSGAPLRHPNGQIRSTFPSLHEGFETQELFDEAIGAKLAKQRATLEIEENHTQKIVARRKRHKAADDKAATDAMRHDFMKHGDGPRKPDANGMFVPKLASIEPKPNAHYKLTKKNRKILRRQMEDDHARKTKERDTLKHQTLDQGIATQLGTDTKNNPDVYHGQGLDRHLHMDEVQKRPVLLTSKEVKEQLRADLNGIVHAKRDRRKSNKQRKLRAERDHAANANQYEGTPGGGSPRRDISGAPIARRDARGEHRLRVTKASNLC